MRDPLTQIPANRNRDLEEAEPREAGPSVLTLDEGDNASTKSDLVLRRRNKPLVTNGR